MIACKATRDTNSQTVHGRINEKFQEIRTAARYVFRETGKYSGDYTRYQSVGDVYRSGLGGCVLRARKQDQSNDQTQRLARQTDAHVRRGDCAHRVARRRSGRRSEDYQNRDGTGVRQRDRCREMFLSPPPLKSPHANCEKPHCSHKMMFPKSETPGSDESARLAATGYPSHALRQIQRPSDSRFAGEIP